jgi:hypothetical protein
MKKTGLLLLLLIGLSLLAVLVLRNKMSDQNALDVSDRAFKIEDTEDIAKVFIAQKNMQPITLTKEDNAWIVEGKYKANEYAVSDMLGFFKNARIKYIPPKAATKNIITELGKIGTKVEVYDSGDELIRTFYIGGNTANGRASYFLMAGADQPYVLEYPGQDILLREKFLRRPMEWRSKVVFDEKPEDIVYAAIEYPKQKNLSFKIEKEGGKFSVSPFYEGVPKFSTELNQNLAETYIQNFKSLGAEYLENENPRKDSINQLVPFANLSFEYKNGGKKSLKLYPVLQVRNPNLTAIELESLKKVQRFYAQSSWGDFYLLQQRLMLKYLRTYDYFYQ